MNDERCFMEESRGEGRRGLMDGRNERVRQSMGMLSPSHYHYGNRREGRRGRGGEEGGRGKEVGEEGKEWGQEDVE